MNPRSLIRKQRAVLLTGLLATLIPPCIANARPATDGPARAKAALASQSIPWLEIGSQAEARYVGDGLSVAPAGAGQWLRCVFQELEGEATAEGLWLKSTVAAEADPRFRVIARAIGRQARSGSNPPTGTNDQVLTLAIWGDGACAGGRFTVAGGKVSGYLASASLNGSPVSTPLEITDIAFAGPSQIRIRFIGTPAQQYQVFAGDTTAPSGLTLLGQASEAAARVHEFVDVVATDARRFFQVRGP